MNNIINLKKTREKLGLTQKEAGVKLGLSEQGYQHWEYMGDRLTLDKVYRVAEAFGVSINDLLK